MEFPKSIYLLSHSPLCYTLSGWERRFPHTDSHSFAAPPPRPLSHPARCSFTPLIWLELIPTQIPRDYASCQNRKHFPGLKLRGGEALTISLSLSLSRTHAHTNIHTRKWDRCLSMISCLLRKDLLKKTQTLQSKCKQGWHSFYGSDTHPGDLKMLSQLCINFALQWQSVSLHPRIALRLD